MEFNKKFTLDSSVAAGNYTVEITINRPSPYYENLNSPRFVDTLIITNTEYSSDLGTSNFYFEGEHVAILNHYTGEIRFSDNFIMPTIITGEDNIEVKFKTQTSVSTDLEYLCYGNNVLVFYDKNNDMTIFTEYNNLEYVPLSNYIKVKALGAYPIGDSTIALFGDNNIYYLSRKVVEAAEQQRYIYSVSAGKPGTILASPYSITSLANDILFLSTDGIKALAFGDNITSNERYALERSGFINSKLLKHKDLSKAKAIAYNNRYYLAVEDVVYIADARYKTSARDQDMNDTFNYEWWYWDNMPVKDWLIIDGKLHFLTNNGYVAEFTEDREDERILMLSSNGASLGLMSPVNDDTIFYQLDMNYVEWLKDGSIIQQNTENSTNKYIICTNDSTKYNGQFQLKDYITEEYLSSNVYLFGNDVKSVYICDKSNVVSEWYTPIVDMGTSIYSKNLLTSTLTFEPDIEGEVKYGFVTRRRAEPIYKDSNVKPTDGVSFDNLDFTDFSFAVGFACSRTLKTRIRNYNYIQFRIVSDNNKDCALNNFVVTYTIGRKNKGVR